MFFVLSTHNHLRSQLKEFNKMVVVNYTELDGLFQDIKQRALCSQQACNVMLLVANEVDAMAATRILTHILRSENIAYKVKPVCNVADIQETLQEMQSMEIKSLFMINCGAVSANIINHLQTIHVACR